MVAADVYGALWRHKFFILLLTGLLAGATWYFTSRQTPTYEAETLVRIQQRITDPGDASSSLVASETLARTYAEIIQTGALRSRVADELASQLPDGAPEDVEFSAEPVEDLDLLWIRVESESPELSALLANAATPALRRFIAETGTLRDTVVTVKPAEVPTEPSSPNMTLNIAIAVLLGLIFNSALALLIELFSDRLPDADELEAALGKPVLGAIPSLEFVPSDKIRADALRSADHAEGHAPPTPTQVGGGGSG